MAVACHGDWSSVHAFRRQWEQRRCSPCWKFESGGRFHDDDIMYATDVAIAVVDVVLLRGELHDLVLEFVCCV